MNPQYLVDTDWVIHYLHGHGAIVHRLDACRPRGLAVSIITVAELYEGVHGSRDPAATERELEQFLRAMTVIGIDNATARCFGRERARLRASRRMIGDVDLLIGATAITHACTLLTNNRRHFERLDTLTIESLPA